MASEPPGRQYTSYNIHVNKKGHSDALWRAVVDSVHCRILPGETFTERPKAMRQLLQTVFRWPRKISRQFEDQPMPAELHRATKALNFCRPWGGKTIRIYPDRLQLPNLVLSKVCRHRLCPHCHARRAQRAFKALEGSQPSLITLWRLGVPLGASQEGPAALEEKLQAAKDRFGRLLERFPCSGYLATRQLQMPTERYPFWAARFSGLFLKPPEEPVEAQQV